MRPPRGRHLSPMRVPDFVEARLTISALQAALGNMRLIAANDRADELESALWRLRALQADADVPR